MTNLKILQKEYERGKKKIKEKLKQKQANTKSFLRAHWEKMQAQEIPLQPLLHTHRQGRKEAERRRRSSSLSRMTQREIANKLAKQSEAHKAAIGREGERARKRFTNLCLFIRQLCRRVCGRVCVCVWGDYV